MAKTLGDVVEAADAYAREMALRGTTPLAVRLRNRFKDVLQEAADAAVDDSERWSTWAHGLASEVDPAAVAGGVEPADVIAAYCRSAPRPVPTVREGTSTPGLAEPLTQMPGESEVDFSQRRAKWNRKRMEERRAAQEAALGTTADERIDARSRAVWGDRAAEGEAG